MKLIAKIAFSGPEGAFNVGDEVRAEGAARVKELVDGGYAEKPEPTEAEKPATLAATKAKK